MNKKVALLASVCLLTMAFAVSAQQVKNTEKFIGEWTLNVEKSELDERSRVEAMTMKVSESVIDNETMLTVTKTTKREQREGGRGILGRQGRGRGGSIDGNNVETINYDLGGKETKSDLNRGQMAGKATAKIKMQKDGSMVIVQNTELDTPRGLMETKNTETWVLSADGKSLTISGKNENPRGNRNSKMVFEKVMYEVRVNNSSEGVEAPKPTKDSGDRKVPMRISGGVINGKATSLPTPEYPEDAQAVNAKGTVNVKVVVDTKGYVMSAEAISGHPLLRAAAVSAAKKAKFGPTYLSGQEVEVSGVLIYKFQ